MLACYYSSAHRDTERTEREANWFEFMVPELPVGLSCVDKGRHKAALGGGTAGNGFRVGLIMVETLVIFDYLHLSIVGNLA